MKEVIVAEARAPGREPSRRNTGRATGEDWRSGRRRLARLPAQPPRRRARPGRSRSQGYVRHPAWRGSPRSLRRPLPTLTSEHHAFPAQTSAGGRCSRPARSRSLTQAGRAQTTRRGLGAPCSLAHTLAGVDPESLGRVPRSARPSARRVTPRHHLAFQASG